MKKKICFFTTHFDLTRQKLLDHYEDALADKAELFLFCKKGEDKKFKLSKVKKIGYSEKNSLVLFKLHKFCRENKIDVVVNFTAAGLTDLVLLFATIFTKTKIITHNHGNFFWRKEALADKDFLSYAIKINLEHFPLFIVQFFTHKFLFCSKDITSKLKKYFFLSKDKIFYLPSAVNTNFYKPQDKVKTRKKLGLDKNDKIILFVGKLHYLKGSDTLLKVIKTNSDKKFILIGSALDENFKEFNLENVIHVPTAIGNKLVEYYNSSDLFLSFSRTEGNSFVPREAMACGTPAMVSDIESMRLYKPAIKVPRDINYIQREIDSFFKLNKKERQKLSKESREFVVKEYSYKSLEKNFQKYFLDLS